VEIPSHELMLEVGRKVDPTAQAGSVTSGVTEQNCAHCRESVVSMQGQVLLLKMEGKDVGQERK